MPGLRFTLALLAAATVVAGLATPAAAAKDRQKPNGPTNLRITASTATSVSLAWDAGRDNSSNWWYCVQHDGAGCVRVDPPRTTMTWPSLLPGRTHSFSVYAIDAGGNRSANSNSVSVTTPADTSPPSPAPTVSLVAAYPTRITVAWTKSTDNTSQVWYSLFVDGALFEGNQIGLQGTTVLYLVPSSTHTFRVTARDAYGNTATSNLLTVTTPAATEAIPPTAPSNLTLGPESSPPEAWLRWTPSTDNTDPQSLILYEVYLNGVLTNDGIIGGTSTVAYCREAGPTEVVLRAVDTSGNRSGASDALIVEC